MKFHNREAWQIENDKLRLTVLKGGGHIAEMLDKNSGVNPLWIPPWPSINPDKYDPERDECYGRNNDRGLLAGIMGHNLCLDTFGPPSDEQLRPGISVHGEASIVQYDGEVRGSELRVSAVLNFSRLSISRSIRLNNEAPNLAYPRSPRANDRTWQSF
jgi:hypothetical protein